MATPKVMKLVNPSTGEMECTVCGGTHVANLRPRFLGGGYYRGSWQCTHGCTLPAKHETAEPAPAA